MSIAAGLVDLFGRNAVAGSGCFLPMRSGAPYAVGTRDHHWIEEDFEIVHREAWENGPDSPDEFRRGAMISWRELHRNHDCTRDLTRVVQQLVDSDLQKHQIVRINIFHRPGAGGSTVARR